MGTDVQAGRQGGAPWRRACVTVSPLFAPGRSARTASGLCFLPGKGLTEAERRTLVDFRTAIEAWLVPTVDADNVEDLVMPVVDGLKAPAGDEATGKSRALAYLIGLSGLPANALAAAVVDILRGEATITVNGRSRLIDPTFRTTPPELAILTRREETLARSTLANIAALLAAPEMPPPRGAADKAKVAAAIAGLHRREEVQDGRPTADGGHARRVAEDLAQRRAARQDGGP